MANIFHIKIKGRPACGVHGATVFAEGKTAIRSRMIKVRAPYAKCAVWYRLCRRCERTVAR